MEVKSLQNQFELKEMQLNSVLEITHAINANLPEKSLYKIYDFTLRANLNISKLALYVLDDQWECKVNFGTGEDYKSRVLDEKFLAISSIQKIDQIQGDTTFSEFECVIPVMHKEKKLAFVFAEGKDVLLNTNFIEALSNIMIVAIENKKLARKEMEQQAREKSIQKELDIASSVQKLLFPKELPENEHLNIFASYIPHRNVGGDYYDFIPISNSEFLLCIADVSGKGMAAAILMANFQASLRTIIRRTINLKLITNELNYQVLQSANGESFITFFVAIYNQRNKELRYVNAGHNPPFLMTEEDNIQALEEGTTILGSFKKLPFLNEGVVKDLQEFLLFSYTDGLTEAFDNEDEPFSPERLEEFLKRNHSKLPRDLHKKLLNEVNTFVGDREFGDDITILSCKVKS